MGNKFIKKSRKALLAMLSLIMAMTSGLAINAEDATVRNKATDLSTTSGVVKLGIDLAKIQTDVLDRTQEGWADKSEESPYAYKDGDTFSATYEVDYFGEPLTVVVDGAVHIPSEQASGTTNRMVRVCKNENGTLSVSGTIDGTGEDLREEAFRPKVDITTSFFDKDGNPVKFTGLLGFNDPDGGQYLCDLAGRNIYYVDADRNVLVSGASSAPDKLADAFIATDSGFYLAEGNKHIGGNAAGYESGQFLVALKDTSYSYTLDLASDEIAVPQLYALKTEQKASVVFFDETSETTLETISDLSGLTGDVLNYDSTSKIDEYLKKGYELVTDETQGAVFDSDANKDQVFKVILKHNETVLTPSNYTPGQALNEDGTAKQPEGLDFNKTITRTIQYKKGSVDGEKLFEDVSETLEFTRDIVVDNVTGEVINENGYTSNNDTFKAVESPALKGYTPDKAVVEEETMIGSESDKVVTVIYLPEQQKAIIHFVKDDGSSIRDDLIVNGGSNENMNKSPISSALNDLFGEGYVPSNNETEGDIVFDDDTNVDQEYTITFIGRKHTVTFVDGWGNEVNVQKDIPHHGSAEEPQAPTHEDYVFVGWDVRFDDITNDTIVTALWREVDPSELFTVTFMDGDTVLHVEKKVMLHGSVIPPENPTKEGYLFTGWDAQFDDITQDTVVKATWIEDDSSKVTVIFLDGFGVNIETQQIRKGKDAVAPENPTKEGYRFIGWDKEFTNVQENLEVNAIWEPRTFTVTFEDGSGNVLSVEKDIPMHGSAKTPPTPYIEGYEFVGWDGLYTNVTKDLTVVAQWKKITSTDVKTGVGFPAFTLLFGATLGAVVLNRKKEEE